MLLEYARANVIPYIIFAVDTVSIFYASIPNTVVFLVDVDVAVSNEKLLSTVSPSTSTVPPMRLAM